MGERVAEQVREHLAQLQRVADHARGGVGFERDRAVGRHRAGVRHGVGRQPGEVDQLELVLGWPVQAGERQQVLDQHPHARGLFLDPAHRVLGRGGLGGGAHPKQLGVAADRRQRGAQLVRGVGQEAAQAGLAGLALLEGLLETIEHRVQSQAEAADLGGLVGGADAVGQVAGCDLARGRLHAVERAQPQSDHQ